MKRSVEPDSPQSRRAGAPDQRGSRGPRRTGRTRKPRAVWVTPAPSARRHAAVASMSCEVVAQTTSQGVSDSAAQMSWRCAIDLDAMPRMEPPSGDGVTIAFKVLFPFGCLV